MTSKHILILQNRLLKWYEENRRDLPWRKTKDFYAIWVSEAMLQQTQVKTVIDYYLRFMREFPTIKHLANAEIGQVLHIWQGLGYYSRARNLHKACQILMKEYDGNPPKNMADFRKLPGVGDYIAAAVYSFVLDLPLPVVDGNVKRVISRIFSIDEPINSSTGMNRVKEMAEMILDRSNPANFNQAIMELGSLVCKPQNPVCLKCPINQLCSSFKSSTQNQFPVKEAKKAVPSYEIAIAIVKSDEKILLAKRNLYGLLGGMWEFPGGKIYINEKPEQACTRILKEKFDLYISTNKFLFTIDHAYSHFKIKGYVFCCQTESNHVQLRDHDEYAWFDDGEIAAIPIHSAHIKILKKLNVVK